MGLENKIVLITGSTSGIGKKAAEIFLLLGARVVINSDRVQNVLRTVGEFKAKGYDCLGIQADVSKSQEVNRMIQKIVNHFGTIDILVNNAAIPSLVKTEAVTLKEWKRVIGVNLTGAFYCTRAVVPIMKMQRSGKIINVSSEAGRQGTATKHGIAYGIAKGGVLAFSQALSSELGRYNIIINAVVPGAIETDAMVGQFDKIGLSLEDLKSQTDLKRLGKVEDAAYLMVFLASDWSNFIAGQCISINGGISKN